MTASIPPFGSGVKWFLRLSVLALVLALLAWFAPGFLFLDDPPRIADAAILFVGPSDGTRMDEARQLLKERKVRYLIIPFSGEVIAAEYASALGGVDWWRAGIIFRVRKAAQYHGYYENTHAEALEARRIMDGMGLKSALLVSSGYHMRRILMIANRVFGRGYTVSCNPARWQNPFDGRDWLVGERRRIIVSEYVKIAWFMLYGLLG